MDVTAEGRASFDALMKVAFAHGAPGDKAVSYAIHKTLGMVLFWTYDPKGENRIRDTELIERKMSRIGAAIPVDAGNEYVNVLPLPYPMDCQATTEFVWNWLQQGADYGKQPDHDGDNGKGYRIFNEAWGHVGNDWRAIIAVQPAWAMYGK